MDSGTTGEVAWRLYCMYCSYPAPLAPPPAASQMVDRLEKQNLVARIPESGDRRVRNVVLSEQGEGFVSQSIEARRSWIKEVPAELSKEHLNQISNALQLLISVYREM